jgi:hypothetical protein
MHLRIHDKVHNLLFFPIPFNYIRIKEQICHNMILVKIIIIMKNILENVIYFSHKNLSVEF